MIWKVYNENKIFYDFCKLEDVPDLFLKESENVIGELKNENPKDLFIDEFCAFKSKQYAYKTKNQT